MASASDGNVNNSIPIEIPPQINLLVNDEQEKNNVTRQEVENDPEQKEIFEQRLKRQKADPTDAQGELAKLGESNNNHEKLCIKVRGLPWKSTKQNVVEFFADACVVDPSNVLILYNENGECYIRFENEADIEKAINKHKSYFDKKRYVEVFKKKEIDYLEAIEQLVGMEDAEYDGVVKVRGLPWSCTKQQVAQFFHGCDFDEDLEKSILFQMNKAGCFSGEAFIIFKTSQDVNKAVLKDKQTIGERWIEVSRSLKGELYGSQSLLRKKLEPSSQVEQTLQGDEWKDPLEQLLPGYGPSAVVRLRGLPFSALKSEVLDFFSSVVFKHEIQEHHIIMAADATGRPSGEAFVIFAEDADAQAAHTMNKKELKGRWIEVFISTRDDMYNRIGIGVATIVTKQDATLKNCVLIKGLPYSATTSDIKSFLFGFELESQRSVFILTAGRLGDKRPTGNAMVCFSSEEQAAAAVRKCHRTTIGERVVDLLLSYKIDLYVETIRCFPLANHSQPHFTRSPNMCLQVKGLPEHFCETEIHHLFSPLLIIGIYICKDNQTRNTGEAFLEFSSSDMTQQALAWNREVVVGDRYIEVFSLAKEEVKKLILISKQPARVPTYGSAHTPAYSSYRPVSRSQASGYPTTAGSPEQWQSEQGAWTGGWGDGGWGSKSWGEGGEGGDGWGGISGEAFGWGRQGYPRSQTQSSQVQHHPYSQHSPHQPHIVEGYQSYHQSRAPPAQAASAPFPQATTFSEYEAQLKIYNEQLAAVGLPPHVPQNQTTNNEYRYGV